MKILTEPKVGSTFDDREIRAIKRVLNSGDNLTRGKDVDLFEKEFAKSCGAKYAVSMSSCGAALNIATKLLRLKKNDEVIVQANAWWVSINHLIERDVNIKVCDVDYSLNIDPNKITPLITKKTKAIYVVHFGGNPANLKEIKRIAKKFNLVVVEDCAHANGSIHHNKKIGYDSDIACFSFSSYKNMVTLGEGGMLVTKHKKYFTEASMLRTNFPIGQKHKRKVKSIGKYFRPKSIAFFHAGDSWDYNWEKLEEMGSTFRLSTPQAAVGRVQLKKLNSFNAQRAKIADRYNDLIDNFAFLKKLQINSDSVCTWHLFNFFISSSLRKKNIRNFFVEKLMERYGIDTFLRFWPINLNGIMRLNGHKLGEAKNFERIWFKEQISFPIAPQMSKKTIDFIINSSNKVLKEIKNEII